MEVGHQFIDGVFRGLCSSLSLCVCLCAVCLILQTPLYEMYWDAALEDRMWFLFNMHWVNFPCSGLLLHLCVCVSVTMWACASWRKKELFCYRINAINKAPRQRPGGCALWGIRPPTSGWDSPQMPGYSVVMFCVMIDFNSKACPKIYYLLIVWVWCVSDTWQSHKCPWN